MKFLLIDFFDARRFPVEKLPFDPGPDYLPSTPSTLKSIEEAAVDVGMQLPELTMRASQTLQRLADSVEEIQHGLDPLLARDGSIARLLDQYEQHRRAARAHRRRRSSRSSSAAKLSNTTGMVRDAAASVSRARGRRHADLRGRARRHGRAAGDARLDPRAHRLPRARPRGAGARAGAEPAGKGVRP